MRYENRHDPYRFFDELRNTPVVQVADGVYVVTGYREPGIAYLCETEQEVATQEAWLDEARQYQVDAHLVRGADIDELFAQLRVTDPIHAFYLGRELMKAKLAISLGKTYRQEGALRWGYLTPPDDRAPKHVKLTQRSSRRRRPQARGGV